MSGLHEVLKKILYQQSMSSLDLEYISENGPLLKARMEAYRFSEYENWGIEHRPGLRHVELPSLRDACPAPALERYLCMHNWRYPSYGQAERDQFLARLLSIRYETLLSYVQGFVDDTFGSYPISGLSVFGGVLYGRAHQAPDDLDLIVLLKDASFTANPVTMYLPELEHEAFYPNAPRPVKTGKVGLTVVGTRAIHQQSRDETVKQFSLVWWGESVPVLGDAFCDSPPPPAALLPHPIRLLAWGYKDILMNQTSISAITRSLSRVAVGIGVAQTVVDRLGLAYEVGQCPQGIWHSCSETSAPDTLIDLYVESSRRLSRTVGDLECIVRQRSLSRLAHIRQQLQVHSEPDPICAVRETGIADA
jgi:hypothetical protein